MSSFNSSENTETTMNPIETFFQTMASSSMLQPQSSVSSNDMSFINEKALLMMAKMGYKSGAGLGKKEEGPVYPINVQVNLGTRGLGLKIQGLEANNESWDFNQEMINVREELKWISSSNYDWRSRCCGDLVSWMIKGPAKFNVDDETHFCDPVILQNVLKAKGVFDELDAMELCKARARANPFETIRSAFFMNRAALKMANIDAVTNFIFTDIDRNPHHSKNKGPYYFADVCAGPGGFSEYILWRKKWLFKGFGFTLKGEHDFQLNESHCASPVTFSAQYGVQNDGDVCCPGNIKHFSERILHETGEGVHFMTSDGGFSVEGNENLQEILSKQLYVCQCLMALEIVRPHGHFVTKLFDLFTPFSIGLIFLMYNCFEKVAILKPNTSRPANAERYLICYGLRKCSLTLEIRNYLTRIATQLWELRQVLNDAAVDISEIVPMSVIKGDANFYSYVTESNNRIGANQITGLLKLATFCRNTKLFEPRQEELRAECLKFWRIPDKPKIPFPKLTVTDLLKRAVDNTDFMYVPPKQIRDMQQLAKLLTENNNWQYLFSGCNKKTHICNFYAGVGGSKVFRLQGYNWVKVKKLQLIRGTLLYGEMVKENVVQHTTYERLVKKQSLHVIDALRLGDTSLADLPFKERLDLIDTYCQAINHESQNNHVRVRPKPINPLQEFNTASSLLVSERTNENNMCLLPVLGFNSAKEYYEANSVLLLNLDRDQLFHSTFASRIQIFFSKSEIDQNHHSGSESMITLPLLAEYVRSNVN